MKKLRDPRVQAILVTAAFAVFFLCLRSRHYTGIDGADRSAGVFFAEKPFLHGSNHLLYPLHLSLYMTARGLLFGRASDAFAYFFGATTLNAWCAAGALGFFFWLLTRASVKTAAAIAATVALGTSVAFGINATHPNETMPGLFLSLIAVAITARSYRGNGSVGAVLAGALLAYAAACYQSMAAILPALMAAPLWPGGRWRRAAIIGAGFTAGCLFIFPLAHAIVGEDWLVGLSRLFAMDGRGDRGSFGGLSPKHLVTLPFGFLQAVFALPYGGLKLLATGPPLVWLTWGTAAAFLAAPAALALMDRKLREPWLPPVLALAGTSMLCPFLWEVSYLKLWAQPLVALGAALALAVGRGRRAIFSFGVLALVIALWNLLHLFIPNHRGYPEVELAARKVEAAVPTHAVVFRGWDPVSVTWAAFYPQSTRILIDVPRAAMTDAPEMVLHRIEEVSRVALRRGRPVFFLGLLAMREPEWNAFLGFRLGLPFEGLAPYRRVAGEVEGVPWLHRLDERGIDDR